MTPELKAALEVLSTWAGYIGTVWSVVSTAWSVVGPIIVLPAYRWLRGFWRSYRGLLEAVRVFANRDRRILDLERRLSFALCGDGDRPGLLPVMRAWMQRQDVPPATLAQLEAIQAEIADIHHLADQLRDTAFRSPQYEGWRQAREDEALKARAAGRMTPKIFFDQGDLDARGLHVLADRK